MVILHGMPQAPDDMWRFGGPLSERYTVTVAHLAGYGRTPPWPAPYDIAAVDAALVEALREAGVREPVLIGMSMGSYRALQIALDHPQLGVRATAHLGPLAFLDEPSREGMRQSAAALRAGVDLTEPLVQRMFGPAYAEAHPGRCREVIAEMLASVPAEAGADELEAIAEMPDLRPRLGEIRTPVYMRVGELDPASPVAGAEEILERVPNGQLDVVPGCGHLLHYEDLDDTVAALRGFLADVTG